jgi:hypothetical protein
MMKQLSPSENQIHRVTNFKDLVSTSFIGETNVISWARELKGNFSEIVEKLELKENITTVGQEDLLKLQLSEQGQLAREILINDLSLLKDHGASPVLNLIKHYDRDSANPFFPTDVYSFHVDRSPIPTDTFLCTYFGETSEIISNSQAEQKILVPKIRDGLKKEFHGREKEFENYLSENFYDLHYQAKPNAQPISLGLGHLYRLAVDHPESRVLPCIHRAPEEKNGQTRLLLIC